MKTIISFLFLFLLFATVACQTTKSTHEVIVNAGIEDHSTASYSFPKGEYHSYHFPENTEQEFDVQSLIENLVKEKIPITDLWYKSGSRSCLPPGSEMAMQVIVEPVLIIRLEKSDEKIASIGFTKCNLPEMGDCAYRVKRYRF